MTGRLPPPVPDQLLRRLADDRDAARARVEQLTTELADARHHLERLETTHQMLLDLAGAAGPPLPPAYRDILTVLADHPGGLRTKDVALALNLPATSKNTVEGIRAKLKRLVGRDLAEEPETGFFTIKRGPGSEHKERGCTELGRGGRSGSEAAAACADTRACPPNGHGALRSAFCSIESSVDVRARRFAAQSRRSGAQSNSRSVLAAVIIPVG
ncbi:hypothetical protein [Actinomadura sp. WMMB 499]|uniref:hypothetical protein n=1 Tax=Actinomadura sp. WMMB 499 TaxID=1219491 RepID=UPI001244BC30|nr:hypothetical protein [Actinomadura sp. WMMB 499]QFG20273.1 hypothetical protein F7P10_02855 [Actinomadura sp. WMMB 499]